MKRIAGAAFAFVLLMCIPDRVEAACSISTTGVSFGPYNVFDTAPADSTGSVRYQCTGSVGILTISLGPGSGGTYQPRRMVSGTNTLNYNLYLDAARVLLWGDGSGGTSWFTAAAASGKAVTVTVFGRIPAAQDVAAGTYTDTIVVTIQF